MKPLLVILFLSLGYSLLAQNESSNDGNYTMHIKKATGKIIIDGKLDEADWQTATALTNFKQNYPSDTSQAEMQTIARVTFDDQFIYDQLALPFEARKIPMKQIFPANGDLPFKTWKKSQNKVEY